MVSIKEMNVKKFIRNKILSCFGITKALVSDNGTQFMGKSMKKILGELKIEFYNSTLSYPHAMGSPRHPTGQL